MIRFISYCFSALAFGMFIYTFFYVDDLSLRGQAIYWFYTSVVSAFLPQIRQLRYKDLEVTFKKELNKVKDGLDGKTDSLKQAFLSVSQHIYQIQQEFFQTLEKGDKQGALESTDRAFRTLDLLSSNFPDDPQIENARAYMYKNRALVLKQLGQNEDSNRSLAEAQRLFEGVLRQNPEDAGAWNGLGSVFIVKEDAKRALEYIDRALSIQPEYDAAKHDRQLAMRILKQEENK
jgi:tetratricopeptide (TPR) repeat protein